MSEHSILASPLCGGSCRRLKGVPAQPATPVVQRIPRPLKKPGTPASLDSHAFSFPAPTLAETFEKLMIPLSPPCGGRCHGVTEGGSAASDQIGLEMGSPPSAFGISPARGAKGTYSKVSARGEKRSFAKVSSWGKLPKAEGGSPFGHRREVFRAFLRPVHIGGQQHRAPPLRASFALRDGKAPASQQARRCQSTPSERLVRIQSVARGSA